MFCRVLFEYLRFFDPEAAVRIFLKRFLGFESRDDLDLGGGGVGLSRMDPLWLGLSKLLICGGMRSLDLWTSRSRDFLDFLSFFRNRPNMAFIGFYSRFIFLIYFPRNFVDGVLNLLINLFSV